jgi:hypothetical protein
MRLCVFALPLLLLFYTCPGNKPAGATTTVTNSKAVGDDTMLKKQIANTYNSYRNLFSKVEPPYLIDLDTVGQDYFYADSSGVISDSLGNRLTDRLIPKEMARTWITDSTYLETKGEQVDWITSFDKFFAPDNSGWYTLLPSIRIESPDLDFLFILKYVQTSFTNGGFTTVYLLTYTRDGRLKKIKDLGHCGYNTSRDMKDEGESFYLKRVTDTYTMQLAYKTIGKVDIVEKKTEEKEVSISGKREVNSTKRRVLYKKHKTIRLE